MPWTTANGISINYQLAGQSGPVVVLLHEMGGTLDSWDAVAPGLAENYRVLRYDQRGAGLTEKVRQVYTNDDAVDDLEGVLKNLKLAPPYQLRLRGGRQHPGAALPGAPSRAGGLDRALQSRARRRSRAAPARWSSAPSRRRSDGMRGVMGITLDKSYPPDAGRAARPMTPIAAAISPTIPWALGSRIACWLAPTCCTCCRR